MSTATDPGTDTETAADAPRPPVRIKPHQLAIAAGVGIGIFTLFSGILPQITGWKSDSPIHRVVFVNVPGPLQVAFYTIMPVALVWVECPCGPQRQPNRNHCCDHGRIGATNQ